MLSVEERLYFKRYGIRVQTVAGRNEYWVCPRSQVSPTRYKMEIEMGSVSSLRRVYICQQSITSDALPQVWQWIRIISNKKGGQDTISCIELGRCCVKMTIRANSVRTRYGTQQEGSQVTLVMGMRPRMIEWCFSGSLLAQKMRIWEYELTSLINRSIPT